MVSQDRELFGVTIKQETKTGMLNLSDLQDAYDSNRVPMEWSKGRSFTNVLAAEENHERIYHIIKDEYLSMVDINDFLQQMKQSPSKTLKKYGVYKTTGRGENRSSWCNPYIWVMIAMEMNSELYGKAIKWLTDKLILNRIEAGNFYKGFTDNIREWNPNYPKIAYALNQIVFGRHEIGIRNNATEPQLKQLTDVQKKLSFAIEMGYINNETKLMEEMRKIYKLNK